MFSPTTDPWPMAVICVIPALVSLGLWGTRRTRTPLIVGIILLVLAGGSFLIDALVDTPAEIILAKQEDMVRSFQKGDTERVISFFSQQPRSAPFMAQVGAASKLVKVHEDMRLTDMHVELVAEGSQAIVHFRVNATVELTLPGGGGAGTTHVATRWELTWQKEAGDWKVSVVKRLHPIQGKEIGLFSGEGG